MKRRSALLIALTLIAGCGPKPLFPRRSPTPGRVEFRLRVARAAHEVAVIGSFNGWDSAAGPMDDPDGDGVFTAHIELAPGRHRYAFVVDGAVVVPPDAPRLEADDFGSKHGVLVVPEDLFDVL